MLDTPILKQKRMDRSNIQGRLNKGWKLVNVFLAFQLWPLQ